MTEPLPLVQVDETELKVPRLGLGTAHIGKKGEAEAVAIVQRALEVGIAFLDTAPLYRTEPLLGLALAGVPRDSYVLATKVGRLPDGQGRYQPDYSRDGILKSFELSLKTLGVDRIDILHIHDPDHHYDQALHEAYPALAELRRQGVIQAVGSGMNQWQMLADFAQNADFDCFLLAGRYTLLEQNSLEGLEIIRQTHTSIFAGGVYNTGILATGATTNATYNYRLAPPEIMDKARHLEAICTRYGVPLNAAAVQFAAAHPAITSLVLGADAADQINENLQAFFTPIPDAFWEDIRAEGLIESGAPTPKAVP
ncbi:MAG: aldo/keto reductase [Anaerolineae bacterium]|nr:aldo/keto reductase [Anaerolineae bacterium]